jgi:hypothetical protein
MVIDTLEGYFLFGFFALWFAVTALCQLPIPLSERIQRMDVINVIPRWNFFAPTPGTYDVHLLFRDRLPDESLSRWYEVPRSIPPRLINPLWNPGRRHNKAVFDATRHLADESSRYRETPDLVQLSLPYIVILNFVSSLPRSYPACQTQFLLMRSFDRASFSQPSTIFLSSMHSLEESERG